LLLNDRIKQVFIGIQSDSGFSPWKMLANKRECKCRQPKTDADLSGVQPHPHLLPQSLRDHVSQ